MKIFTIISLSLILTNTAISQLNKGQFLLGGNISFESVKNSLENTGGYKFENFFISPNIGYFIIPKLAGGLRVDISFYKQTTPTAYNQRDIALSPFLRYYLLSAKQKFNVLVDVAYINLRSKSRIQNSSASYIQKTNGYNISAGPSVFLNEHVALEFLLGYKHTTNKDIDDNKTSTFSTGLGLQVHLGKIKLRKKQH